MRETDKQRNKRKPKGLKGQNVIINKVGKRLCFRIKAER